ncbi:MAG: thioredoxin-disulfide reductase [Desulfohalobiaceae bacterium]|nr:thioredoxin-disulfide reductase [Desulfohalobiaceae bacterium]
MKDAYDLVIIGGGPAGLTAAIYAGRARMDALLIEMISPGGQVLTTDWIENYPGFPEGVSGGELVMKMNEQMERFGIDVESAEVSQVDFSEESHRITLEDRSIACRSMIIATGSSPNKLKVPGEDTFYGKGVSTCATCDAAFYRDKVVAAVGGGDTAVQEALFLTKFVEKVYLIHRRDELRATKILQERVLANEKIELVWDSVVTEIGGSGMTVDQVTVKNVKTGATRSLAVDGCFVWVGTKPNAQFLGNGLKADDWGFIQTDQHMETSVPGVYAVGDVRATPLRQIVTAVGDAAIAVHTAEAYLQK